MAVNIIFMNYIFCSWFNLLSFQIIKIWWNRFDVLPWIVTKNVLLNNFLTPIIKTVRNMYNLKYLIYLVLI